MGCRRGEVWGRGSVRRRSRGRRKSTRDMKICCRPPLATQTLGGSCGVYSPPGHSHLQDTNCHTTGDRNFPGGRWCTWHAGLTPMTMAMRWRRCPTQGAHVSCHSLVLVSHSPSTCCVVTCDMFTDFCLLMTDKQQQQHLETN